MKTDPEVGAWLAAHDVFWLSEDELVYWVSSAGIDWTACEATDFHRTQTLDSLCEYLRERTMRQGPEAEAFLAFPVHRQFEVYAQLNPGAGAVKFGRTELTYGELDTQADGLAVRLQQNGLGPGEFCALYMVPSLAMVRAILAVLKAGAACLMLDPALPRERIAAILSVSDPRAVITQERFLSALSATNTPAMVCGEDAADLPCSWPQEYPTRRFTPAYAVASFCETGSLSIVVRTHKAVLAKLGAVQEISPVGHGDSILQNRNSSLDVWELLWLLSHGAQVVIRPAPEEANPDRARQSIGRENISRTQVVPLLSQRLPVGARRSEMRSLRASLWTSERPGVHRRKACND